MVPVVYVSVTTNIYLEMLLCTKYTNQYIPFLLFYVCMNHVTCDFRTKVQHSLNGIIQQKLT